MAFTLLNGRTFYKEQVEKLDGYWDNGLYHEGEETITYPTFTGHYEPMTAEESELLPSGVKTSAAIWLYTAEELKTYSDYETDSSGKADIIYLHDPESGTRKARPYKVWESEVWETGDDFIMVDEEHSYICIREDKR
jgi:hypothetical protein